MTAWAALLAAFVAGLVGSGHCVAMCGAIAGAINRGGQGGYAGALLSSCGRLVSYALAGALVASATQLLDLLVHAERLRSIAAVASGLALLLLGLRLAGLLRWVALDRAAARLWTRIAPLTRSLGRLPPALRPLAAGMLWGWMPCGMAYAMLALAAASADPGQGAALMLAFGLGTLPALLAVAGLAGARSWQKFRPAWRFAAGIALACAGASSAVIALWPATHVGHSAPSAASAAHAAHLPTAD